VRKEPVTDTCSGGDRLCHSKVQQSLFVQFFRMYVGVYGHAFPEMMASTDPMAFLRGARVHMTPQCRSLAVAFDEARFRAVPPSVQGVTYVFENSTIWFSSQQQVRCPHLHTLHVAEVCRRLWLLRC
jgi:hypothetical protein